MPLLHVYDASDSAIRQTAATRGATDVLAISRAEEFYPALDRLVAARMSFDRILFETHGSPGKIYFGGQHVDACYWDACQNRNWHQITASNARVYFNGCNVAESSCGWGFLDAAARVLVGPGGGTVFGQTSVGFGNPFNGHVVHLWGDTRTVTVAFDGRIVSRDEQ